MSSNGKRRCKLHAITRRFVLNLLNFDLQTGKTGPEFTDLPTCRPSRSVSQWNAAAEVQNNYSFAIIACRNFNITDAIMQKLDRYATDLEHMIEERTHELQEERKKSDLLLYTMLPP